MTQEEKAKAYDKALERARKIHSKIVNEELLGFPGQIEDIFPELRKEEKPLTSFQQCLNCILRGVYYAEVPDEKVDEFILNVVRTRTDELIKLAKRHEYTDCQLRESEDERIRKGLIEALKASKTVGELKFVLPYPTREECISYLEKQKEQKPAEWDEYTKINLGRALQIINNAKGKLQGYQSDDGIYECDKAIECLEHFLYRGLEIEKPAEWSEEDEDMLNSCISSIEEAKENRYAYKETDGDTSYDHEIAWLKSLRPRQKVEWSEEDESELTAVIYCVSRAIKASKDENERNSLLSAKNWLQDKLSFRVQSLRPSWKPSEEQMYILNWVTNILLNHDGIVEKEASKKLQSLYNDLKKLM